ncbi:PREDICTED: uncharacterized protein LOC105960741 [Erythranthe guttata]|uniref:uncharacterized protein LOC105960741 n=1 Tax=Erythranthe guttata TaxID=4155 RepID=UPI00064DA690|nr:PREDICTED: uncharacterized protein LOC105960741 [Erythranthe guttata]|eukprot:XP_012840404.1 PREDICTED: uncharacterized protein LOC105960741 [Erythranthe guttata]
MTTTQASIRNLETQMGQLATQLTARPSGALPSNTEDPRKNNVEQCNAVSLRNGRQLEEAPRKEKQNTVIEEPNVIGEKEATRKEPPSPTVNSRVPQVPYPQKLKKKKLDTEHQGFLDKLKEIHINIPFIEAIQKMPKWDKLQGNEIIQLTEQCSEILVRPLPQKLGDPGKFTIPCTIGGKNFSANKNPCDNNDCYAIDLVDFTNHDDFDVLILDHGKGSLSAGDGGGKNSRTEQVYCASSISTPPRDTQKSWGGDNNDERARWMWPPKEPNEHYWGEEFNRQRRSQIPTNRRFQIPITSSLLFWKRNSVISAAMAAAMKVTKVTLHLNNDEEDLFLFFLELGIRRMWGKERMKPAPDLDNDKATPPNLGRTAAFRSPPFLFEG